LARYKSVADEGAGQKAVTATSVEVVPANPDRLYFYCRNVNATYTISLGFGEAAVVKKGVHLAAETATNSKPDWEMPAASIWTGAINAISSGGTPLMCYVEW
jgi:hypothetical protein